MAETDTLLLVDISVEDVVLSTSGNDLTVTISATGETITVSNVFASTSNGNGIEQILFQNGEVIRINDIGALSLEIIDSDDSHSLQGTGESDVLRGNGGNDTLHGQAGDDLLSGGADNDTLEGGQGSDTLQGDEGNDVLRGDHTNANVETYTGMIYRAYRAVLDREPDETELQSGINGLIGGQALGGVMSSLLGSSEFQNAHGSTTDTEFVTLLYNNALNRAPDAGGLAWWSGQITNGNMTRAQVAVSFAQSQEAINTSQSDLVSFMRGLGEDDRLVGGEGSDVLVGGWMSDTFVFDADHAGSDSVVDLEAWDTIELQDSSFADSAAALAALVQNGSDVVLTVGNTTVTFEDVLVSEFTEDMFVIV
jgi:Ca2+-binding RTX toxin-like protein